jgi:hypothetical protein
MMIESVECPLRTCEFGHSSAGWSRIVEGELFSVDFALKAHDTQEQDLRLIGLDANMHMVDERKMGRTGLGLGSRR